MTRFCVWLLFSLGGIALADESRSIKMRISAGIDDAVEFDSGRVDRNSKTLDFSQRTGLRFSPLGIPRGAKIEEAYIQFSAAVPARTPVNLKIEVEFWDSSTFLDEYYDLSKRFLSPYSLEWQPGSWVVDGARGLAQRTPNLAELLQELVSFESWNLKSSFGLQITGGEREAYAREAGASLAPELYVRFTSADMPPVEDDPWAIATERQHICVIGDGGMGNRAQREVADALSFEDCNILYAGDVIYNDGITSPDDPLWREAFYDPYESMLLEEDRKFFLSMGNHDWYGDVEPWFEIAASQPNIVYDNYFYLKKVRDICLIALDTNNYFSEQEVWLRNLRSEGAMDSCRVSLAFAHHPFYSSGKHGNAKGSLKNFLLATVIGKVDFYLSGHDHIISDEGVVAGTRLLISGTAAKLRNVEDNPRGGFGLGEIGYLLIEFGRNYGKYTFKTVDGDRVRERHSGQWQEFRD